ncbi:hypothetical protein ACFL0Q_02290, partial [Thermodesulfobacteriota bacterium]
MRDKRTDSFVAAALMTFVLFAFHPVLLNDFINLDDPLYVTGNEAVQAGITRQSLVWAFHSLESGNWHPLTWISLMIDHEVFGLDPAGFHWTNLLFHIANTTLVFLVLREATAKRWESAAVAALFGLHPLNVEPVAWVSERKEVLSMFFGLLTLLTYVRYSRKPGIVRYVPVPFLYTLALMAKPMLVTLPFVLLLLDFWPLKRWGPVRSSTQLLHQSDGAGKVCLRHLVCEKLPLFFISTLSSSMAWVAQCRGGAVASLETLSFGARLLHVPVSYSWYLSKSVNPRFLAVLYPHPGNVVPAWEATGPTLLIGGLSLLALSQIERRPFVTVGWLWFLGAMVPVIGLVQIGVHAVADRYMYYPGIGLFVAVVWGVASITHGGRLKRPVLAAGSSITLLSLLLVTSMQIRVWRDSEQLFTHALAVTERNYVAHDLLGCEMAKDGKWNRAAAHWVRAREINPSYPGANLNLAVFLTSRGR